MIFNFKDYIKMLIPGTIAGLLVTLNQAYQRVDQQGVVHYQHLLAKLLLSSILSTLLCMLFLVLVELYNRYRQR